MRPGGEGGKRVKRVGAVLGLGLAVCGPAWGADALGVLGQFEAALNAGNVDACVAWMAKDGVIRERTGKEVRGAKEARPSFWATRPSSRP